MSVNEHINEFADHLDNLLTNLSQRYPTSYICLDSNINHLITHANHPSHEYFQTISSNGFIQCIRKATRIVNNSHSLIDHIVTNTREEVIESGTLIMDISDHFMTFIKLKNSHTKVKSKPKLSKNLSKENINKFKINLQTQTWENVLTCFDVNDSYNAFWDTFKFLFDINFPDKVTKQNKNLHKLNEFMTNGLLISRINKNNLHKTAVQTPSVENVDRYKAYRNVYNKLLRASKKTYFCESLHQAKKIQKNMGYTE
jgi:hypothetical protein